MRKHSIISIDGTLSRAGMHCSGIDISTFLKNFHIIFCIKEGKVVPYMSRRHRGGVEVKLSSVTSSMLDGGEMSCYAPATLPPGKEPWCPLKWSLLDMFGNEKISSNRDSNSGLSSP
jgi:hypothetical protein